MGTLTILTLVVFLQGGVVDYQAFQAPDQVTCEMALPGMLKSAIGTQVAGEDGEKRLILDAQGVCTTFTQGENAGLTK